MGLLSISELSGDATSSPLDLTRGRAAALDVLTTPGAGPLPRGEPTEQWFRRMERTRFVSLSRRRGRHLTRNEWVYLRREDPELLRDWLFTGKYSPPPYLLFPGQDSTPAMTARRQSALHTTSRPKGYSWSRLSTSGEAALLQAEEMSRRSGSVRRPAAWASEGYTDLEVKRVAAQEAEARRRAAGQDVTLTALTAGSAAFQRMTPDQKTAYLNKLAPSFRGSLLLANLRDQASKQRSRDLAYDRDQRAAIARAPRDIRAEHARMQAAGRRARDWSNQRNARALYDSAYILGYDRVPHGTRRPVRKARNVLRRPPPPLSAYAPLPPYVRPTPVPYSRRPVTGGGVWYGPRPTPRTLAPLAPPVPAYVVPPTLASQVAAIPAPVAPTLLPTLAPTPYVQPAAYVPSTYTTVQPTTLQAQAGVAYPSPYTPGGPAYYGVY